MTVEKVKELCNAQPFRAFSLHLPDGRQVEVDYPDSFSLSGSGRLMNVLQPDESESIIDLLLVSDITLKNVSAR